MFDFVRMCIAMVYDGHARNTANLGPSVFITFTLASATELPADLTVVFLLDRLGRRRMACYSLILSGFFSFASLAVPGKTL